MQQVLSGLNPTEAHDFVSVYIDDGAGVFEKFGWSSLVWYTCDFVHMYSGSVRLSWIPFTSWGKYKYPVRGMSTQMIPMYWEDLVGWVRWWRVDVTLTHLSSLQLKYELDFTHKDFYPFHISYHVNPIWSGLVGLLVVLAMAAITYKTCISCRSVYENIKRNTCSVFKIRCVNALFLQFVM